MRDIDSEVHAGRRDRNYVCVEIRCAKTGLVDAVYTHGPISPISYEIKRIDETNQVIKYSMVRLQYAQIKASCRVMPDNTTPPKSRVAVHVHHPHPVPRPSASAPDHTLPSF